MTTSVQAKPATGSGQAAVFGATLIAALGGLLFGYDTAVISGAVAAIDVNFVKPQNLTEARSASLLGFITSFALWGTAVGALFAAFLASRFGRKSTMIVSAILFAVSGVGSAFPELFIGKIGEMGVAALLPFNIYRFIGGVGIGLASVVCPMYIAEIAPPRLRGRLVSLNQFAIVTGIFGVFFVNYYIASLGDEAWVNATGWRWMLASEVLFAVAFLVLLFATPESPRWLVSKNRLDEAKGVLGRFNPPADVAAVFEEIRRSLTARPSAPVFSFGVLVVFVGVMLSVFQQFVGINAVLYYAPEIFKKMGASTNAAFLQTVLVGGVNFLFTLVAYVTVDRYGRKPLLVVGALIMASAMAALGFFFYTQSLGLPALAVMLIYVAGFALSWGPVVWVLLAEMFPNAIRNAALPIAVAAQWLSNIAVTWSHPWLVATFDNAFAYWFYAAMSALAALFVWRLVPETKHKSLEELEAVWRR